MRVGDFEGDWLRRNKEVLRSDLQVLEEIFLVIDLSILQKISSYNTFNQLVRATRISWGHLGMLDSTGFLWALCGATPVNLVEFSEHFLGMKLRAISNSNNNSAWVVHNSFWGPF